MATTLRFREFALGGKPVRCPDRAASEPPPTELTLIPSGPHVMATCGKKHGGARFGKGATQCFFHVDKLSSLHLSTLAGQAKPGRISAKLPGGIELSGQLLAVGAATPQQGQAAADFARAAQQSGPARISSGGGAAKAAFMALASGFGAVSSVANAAGGAVGATAGMVGKFADVATEGIGASRDAIQVADNVSARRHERLMHEPDASPPDPGPATAPPGP